MATKKNFLKYSGLTYEEIIQQINDKLVADKRFDNFRESAIAQTLIEIFAGTVDIVNYYLDRRAEECYFDTARLKSSVILLARQLGYVVKRPIPAESTVKIELKGDLSGIATGGDRLQIPYHRVLSYKGYNFILKNGFTYTLTNADITTLAAGGTVTLTKNDDKNAITIVQGEIKEKIIEGSTNTQVGQRFQIYRIPDTKFSNRYGSEDFDISVTKVWVGNTKSDETEYSIDRRSLINWESIESFNSQEDSKVCVVRTSTNEDVEVMFGDAQFAALGANISAANTPQTTYDNVYIQYLATEGSQANQVGILDEKLVFADKVILKNQDVTSYVTFKFNSNIIGGADLEDIDSIKVNAPEIYYSLDRLVTKRDYIAYLKSLTSPINFKNAIAWGEQEEINFQQTSGTAILDLFNVVLFSCVGSLYNTEGDEVNDTFSVLNQDTGIGNAILDLDFDEYQFTDNSYYNIYVTRNTGDYCNKEVARQIKNYKTVNTSEVYYLYQGGEIIPNSLYNIIPVASGSTNFTYHIEYTSRNNLAGVVGTTSAILDLSTATSYFDIATALQTSLVAIKDKRPGSSTYGSDAFAGLTVEYTGTFTTPTGKYDVNGSTTDNCYITKFYDSDTGEIINNMKLLYSRPDIVKKFLYKTVEGDLSKGIVDLVNDLDTRSQVTIRNVYITPVVQSFDIIGKVYLNQLYDSLDMQRQINNQIYKFLDRNADFNKDIYLSNIVEIIESFPGVINANIQFSADAPISTGRIYWNWVGLEDIIPNDGTAVPNISLNLDTRIPNDSLQQAIFQQFSIYYNNNIINGRATERNFLTDFVQTTYIALANPIFIDGITFRDTILFREVLADIKKDVTKFIKKNMIDNSGNIAIDEENADIGGYSLGNEIVKIQSKILYEYKS